MFSEDDVHKGLIEPEARTFLAKEYSALLDECSLSTETIEEVIAQLQADLEIHRKRLILAKQREAIELIISSKGWSIHDVSEEVVEFMDEVYPFVGTQREFDQQFLVPISCDPDLE